MFRIISKQAADCYYNNIRDQGGRYLYNICTTEHYTPYYKAYKIFYSNTIFYRLTWVYNAAKKNRKIKPNQRITQPQK